MAEAVSVEKSYQSERSRHQFRYYVLNTEKLLGTTEK